MAESKPVTVYHPDLPISQEVPADMKERFIDAGWKASKPKGVAAPEAE